MKIHKAHFLLLTSALAAAAAGCKITSATPLDGGSIPGDDSGLLTPAGDAGRDAQTDSPSTGDGSALDAAADVVACTDELPDGGAFQCTTVPTNKSCVPTTYLDCAGVVAATKPKVAKEAFDCMLALPSCEGGVGLPECIATALNASCTDTSAVATCQQAEQACGGDAGASFRAQCEKLAGGLTPAGRATFLTCFAEGCPASPSVCMQLIGVQTGQ